MQHSLLTGIVFAQSEYLRWSTLQKSSSLLLRRRSKNVCVVTKVITVIIKNNCVCAYVYIYICLLSRFGKELSIDTSLQTNNILVLTLVPPISRRSNYIHLTCMPLPWKMLISLFLSLSLSHFLYTQVHNVYTHTCTHTHKHTRKHFFRLLLLSLGCKWNAVLTFITTINWHSWGYLFQWPSNSVFMFVFVFQQQRRLNWTFLNTNLRCVNGFLWRSESQILWIGYFPVSWWCPKVI